MTYTGEVTPGGEPDVRELDALRITKLAVDPEMSNNCYLLACRRTGEQVLIDAAAESDRLLPLVGDAGLAAVVTTHRHWDHHRALADVVGATGAAVVVGAPDAVSVTEQTGVPVTREVRQGDTVAVGDCTLEVIALAGHTPGSIALLYDDPSGHPHLFTGDSLFPGGPGRTTNEADFTRLMDDLEARIFQRLPDSTWFYPGHGNDSILGQERPRLGEWRARGW
ncbi:glyoxylase-like metal-dependent hydrolase (beta-lactamase superfamily II) [Nocardioides panaciterrulae]|uniref:Glyoxylase-like metal-dependent hydrolase (Beta-lactamase superfamily II) n=1 Tax=Nocardioides panaciterrulae TaxID=661492 RepID=A0A7Y9JBY2_9ACTN|nr:glyoxylase-like metal-dependent hydrolase (beta-lactamase superfamily II) [Nocardioides panaciterrulae]